MIFNWGLVIGDLGFLSDDFKLGIGNWEFGILDL
jgi:hypothetical protein